MQTILPIACSVTFAAKIFSCSYKQLKYGIFLIDLFFLGGVFQQDTIVLLKDLGIILMRIYRTNLVISKALTNNYPSFGHTMFAVILDVFVQEKNFL